MSTRFDIPTQMVWSDDGDDALIALLATAAGFDSDFETESVVIEVADIAPRLGRNGPALLRIAGGAVAAAQIGRRSTLLLAPDGHSVRVDTSAITAAVVERHAATGCDPIARLIDRAAVPVGRRRDEARRALLSASLAGQRFDVGLIVRASASGSWRQLARAGRFGWWTVVLAGGYIGAYAMLLAAFVGIGDAATAGALSRSDVWTVVALLVAAVPLRLAATHAAGVITIGVGSVLKRRLHAGVLAVEPDSMRSHGAGHFLSLVAEAEAVETLALTGGHAGVVAAVELVAAMVALANGSHATALVALLVIWLSGFALVMRMYADRRGRWTVLRGTLSATLAEQIAGHRTRLVQAGSTLNDTTTDDHAIDGYDHSAQAMDRVAHWMRGTVSRGWMLAALAVILLSPASAVSAGRVAVAVGGILLAAHALDQLLTSATSLTDAAVAWRAIRPILQPVVRRPEVARCGADLGIGLWDVSLVRDGRAIVGGVDLRIAFGDRVLIEGRSGAGKSTVAELLAGIRRPTAGTVTGADQVGLVPQFHANHLISGPLAFNLLLGRAWPPTEQDLGDAWQVCDELGLGPLLARMPAGLETPVGECGWQLSHGERSRIFVARALLQVTDAILLDESFAALDPDALHTTLDTVLRRIPTVIAIAHG